MSDKVVGLRVLFAATVIVFGLETLMAIRGHEPYPALMLPPFTGTFNFTGGDIDVRDADMVVQFADGSKAEIPYGRIVPTSPMNPLGSFVLIARDPVKPETADWLYGRISELYPGQTPASADIHWRLDRYDARVPDAPPRPKIVKTIHLDFKGQK